MISCFTKHGAVKLMKTYEKIGWKPTNLREGGHGWQFDIKES